MLAIDGSGGGGQLLRTALSMSAVTDTPFEIEAIRGDRPNPGLRPQHLAAVELVADLCDADVEGAEPESASLSYRPGEERRTSLEAAIDTAGSVALLFDTVLPIAAADGQPLRVAATGGTDVKWAPTVGYLRRVKLPLLARWGLDAAVDLERTGFYPAGGGEATLSVWPASDGAAACSSDSSDAPSPIHLEERGEIARVDIHSKAAESLADREVADRQAARAAERLADADVRNEIRSVEYVPADSPGSAILLRAVSAHSLSGFDALGEPGLPAEDVADAAVDEFAAFRDGGAPVDAHMADQLAVFLALGGGAVRIPRVTDHVETNLEVLAAFGADVGVERRADGTTVLSASPHPSLP